MIGNVKCKFNSNLENILLIYEEKKCILIVLIQLHLF